MLGASGFLGQHVLTRLRERSIECVAITRTPKQGFDAAIDLARAPQDVVNDLISSFAPTTVINCSGAVRGSTTDLMLGNVVAMQTLLLALLGRAPSARLVQLGSSAEYGAPTAEAPMDEQSPTQPGSPYGYTKLAASELVLRARSQGLDATVLRIFNISGPQSPTSTMLGGLIEQLRTATGQPKITLDSLAGWRDYVDVRDVAAAACSAALLDGEVPPVANIGRGEAVQTGDWVKHLIEVSRTGALLEERSGSAGTHKASAGAVAWQCADITIARKRLGWMPTVPLTDSIRDTWLAATAGYTST
ncbi:NAD-dependent epimerase/dehydratase family protein [Kribbella amoyensis]|uniref:NAD-dependent epimerase/dehydratase family protein n=1 Tax=Kribbella amoyensis TaxID=996641 RepID=UPI0014780D85|nr:NAD(P)-dependent oxidoreductase [Kribbella amoyensis]